MLTKPTSMLFGVLIVLQASWMIEGRSIINGDYAKAAKPTVWTPSSESGLSRREWLQCHGFPCDKWKNITDKLLTLKMASINGAPSFEITPEMRHELMAPTPDMQMDRLDNCIWLTEEQLDSMLAHEQEKAAADPVVKPDADSSLEQVPDSSQVGRKRVKRKLSENAFLRWDKMPIKWKFDGTHSSLEKQIIRSAFQHWMDNTCVRFQEIGTDEKTNDHHILVTRDGQGCYSYVGKISVIPQQLNLQSACISVFGTPVHEIGHSLGLWHEQQRNDRDDHIHILWENLGAYIGQFYKHPTADQGVPYDVGSVMHYGPQSGSKNRMNTMETWDPLYQQNMGQRTGLSFFDTKIINVAYCSKTCTTPLSSPCQRGGYQDPNNCIVCRCPEGFSGDRCQHVASSVNADCSQTIMADHTAQSIKSPGYDSDKHYGNSQSCNWLVKAPKDHLVVLEFEDEFGVYCHSQQQCHHWLEVRHEDDIGVQGPRFCCYNKPTVRVKSTTDEMLLVFRTNWTVPWNSAKRGFHVRVAAELMPGKTTTSTTTTTTTTTTTPRPTTTTTTPTTTTTTPTTTTTTPTTTTPTTTTSTTTSAPVYKKLDLAFAVDASGSVDSDDWRRVQSFISLLLQHVALETPTDVRSSVVSFGDAPTTHFHLHSYYNFADTQAAVQRMDRRHAPADIAGGLRHVRQDVFRADRGDRWDAPNVCVLVTDGASGSDDSRQEAQLMANANIETYVLGVGSDVNLAELRNIVGGDTGHILLLNSYDSLTGNTVIKSLFSRIFAPRSIASTTKSTTTTTKATTTTTTTTTTPPETSGDFKWECDFEDGNGRGTWCGMVQRTDDIFNWTLTNKATPSQQTGPRHAYSGTYYIFIEASKPRKRDDYAEIMLPKFYRSGVYCVQFGYHLYGWHINELRLVQRRGAYKPQTLWSETKDGRQDGKDVWKYAKKEVTLGYGDQLTFVGVRGDEYSGDAALDKIKVISGRC